MPTSGGLGVLAAVLARRGVGRIIGTYGDPRALARAGDNADPAAPDRTDHGGRGALSAERPSRPGRPQPAREAMPHRFPTGLVRHLRPGGEGRLILSDLAERLGPRTRAELPSLFETAGLAVCDRLDTRPRHRRARDTSDPLRTARAAERISLSRLSPDPQVERQPPHGPE
ncbi:hypothetical protein [Streptomyces sp. NBC_00582]|uniref:hypothetical protein n=1 Tax=Streptomyces sp. NBC_00582 TaxID=2975783 RepID=UPI002E81CA6E|nr:hypothetical protein [Streptomyces sp. NBC_00582]WUB62301.1 hypothetical protein OG852_18830 [Streptomyces sp. NBC_00582]